MNTQEATTLINATPEAVWSVIHDGSRYGDWDSGITLLDGEAKAGAKTKIEVEGVDE